MKKERILVVDIGNRSVKIYIVVGDELAGKWQFRREKSQWFGKLDEIARNSGSNRIVLVSVVPNDLKRAEIALKRASMETVIVHGEMELPIILDYGSLKHLGADRIAVAVGAYRFYGDTAEEIVIVDAGSAITIDLVRGAKFLGGAILPGIDMMINALHNGTAQLSIPHGKIKAQFPGKATGQSIIAGTTAAAIGAIEFIWQKMIRNPKTAMMIITGGDAAKISGYLTIPHKMDSILLVRGAIAIADFVKTHGENKNE